MPFGRVTSGGGAGKTREAGWLTRRAVLAGGIGATAVVAMPDLARAGTAERAGTAAPEASAASGAASPGHFFLYGITAPDAEHSAGVQAVNSPGSTPAAAPISTSGPARDTSAASAARDARHASAFTPVPVATSLASAPVASPDQAWL
ncbi:MAG: hypothetical protein ACRDN0_30310, partial [Trebonia sp.]